MKPSVAVSHPDSRHFQLHRRDNPALILMRKMAEILVRARPGSA